MNYSIDFGGKNIIISKENNGSINIVNDNVKNNKNLYIFILFFSCFIVFDKNNFKFCNDAFDHV